MTAPGDLPARGTCFGYELHSGLDWTYLRHGSGEPLAVTVEGPPDEPGELVQEWEPPWSPSHVRLHRSDGLYRLWIEGGGWYGAEPGEGRVLVPGDGEPVRREERALGLPLLLCFLARGDLPLHAAAIQIDGKAVLLAAPRRFGKTTLAAAFAAAGYRLLSEDLACIRPGPPPVVIPGPAMLRVRHDVAGELSIPAARELGRDDDRVHLALEAGRGTCEPVPVGGIALLEGADVEPRLERMGEPEAVRNLWMVSFNLPTEGDRERCFRAVGALAAATPTWRLRRRMMLEDLDPTVEVLVNQVTAGD